MSFTRIPQNIWFNLLRLGMLETVDFIYGNEIEVEYSKQYSLTTSSYLNRLAEQFMKCGK